MMPPGLWFSPKVLLFVFQLQLLRCSHGGRILLFLPLSWELPKPQSPALSCFVVICFSPALCPSVSPTLKPDRGTLDGSAVFAVSVQRAFSAHRTKAAPGKGTPVGQWENG